MNQPIRRRRRRRLGDSSQSDLDLISRTEPSDTPVESTDTESQHDDPPKNTSQAGSEPIRRRRRRRLGDSSESDFSITPTELLDTPVESTDTQSQDDHPPSITPQASPYPNTTTTHQATIDRIRSEIDEDNYHSLLSESDYSDDSHDWGDEGESASNHYWHFLGMYE